MISKLTLDQTAKWIQKLSVACDGDVSHARRQLAWLKEKVIADRQGEIHTRSSDLLTQPEQEQLDIYVNERYIDHKPLQYILGTQPFCDLEIVTRPPILIPRWETEEWTYKVIRLLEQRVKSKPLRILDICTGSGCIALALAKHLPKDSAYITGLDISNKAIELANLNLNTHRSLLRNSVEFHQKDVFELQLQQYLPAYNVIVSNPPYITNQEYKLLDQDVKNWEDPRALVAEEEGTRVHKRIVEVSKYCHPLWNDRPYLFMEIGGTHQIEALSEYMLKHGFKTVDIWKDLADKDRVITGGI